MSRFCMECENTGVLNCYCGGDLCVCDHDGEYDCPFCDGEFGSDDFDGEEEETFLETGKQ